MNLFLLVYIDFLFVSVFVWTSNARNEIYLDQNVSQSIMPSVRSFVDTSQFIFQLHDKNHTVIVWLKIIIYWWHCSKLYNIFCKLKKKQKCLTFQPYTILHSYFKFIKIENAFVLYYDDRFSIRFILFKCDNCLAIALLFKYSTE